MSIQGNFNNNLNQMAMVASTVAISKAIRELGFNSENELRTAIRTLEIEIAKAEDAGQPCDKLKALKEEYSQVLAKHEEEVAEKQRKDKEATVTALVIFGVIAVIAFAWLFATIGSI